MDSRSTFLHHRPGVSTDGGTQKGRPSARLEVCGQARRGMTGKSVIHMPERLWGAAVRVVNWLTPSCQENPLGNAGRCPYRKPTQVGRERILRRAREPSLRNSAKWLRNLGRRSASAGEGAALCCLQSWGRSQRNDRGDCLPKTQVSAKAQAEV